ncbi:MAG: helix-turn-helix domain-containing protein [Clostridiales bacterium]|nr:helix-turn-helix domain-containing protein [Clostridiales bacterium]
MTTGEKISEERKKAGLTQQQFADALGVTRQSVSRWESDLAFPETDTLIKMSEMFGCSIDYLLKYNAAGDATATGGATATNTVDGATAADTAGGASNDNQSGETPFSGFNPLKWSFEYKSKRTVLGMPLVHVNIGLGRRARGFFAVGLISSGIFSAGLLSAGVFSLGCLSLGLITLGGLAFGGCALGAIALGIVALGGVAAGIIALGGVAVGCYSLGGCSVGLFAVGGYADGKYIAVGDYAVGRIAFGKTTATGGDISVTDENFSELKEEAWRLMDNLPAFWRGFINSCKSFAEKFMLAP